jgi:hypothetical protein
LAWPAAAQEPPPVEAYGRLPGVTDVAISPDGRHLAMLGYSNNQNAFRVVNLETGATVYGSTAQGASKLRGVGWASDEHALFYLSETLDTSRVLPFGLRFRGNPGQLEYWRVGAHSLRTGRQNYLTVGDDYWAGVRVGLTSVTAPIDGDPGGGRMISWSSDGRMGVYRVPLDGGRSRLTGTGDTDTVDIILNDEGEIGARLDSDETSNRWQLFIHDGGSPRMLMEDVSDTGAPIWIAGFMQDGRLAVADRLNDDDRDRFYAIDTTTGVAEVVVEHERFDVGGGISDPWTHRIIGAAWTEDFPRQRFFDEALAAVYQRMQGHFASGYAVLVSWSRDRSRVVVFAETSQDAGGYYLFEPQGNRLVVIGRTYPEISGAAALGARRRSPTARATACVCRHI